MFRFDCWWRRGGTKVLSTTSAVLERDLLMAEGGLETGCSVGARAVEEEIGPFSHGSTGRLRACSRRRSGSDSRSLFPPSALAQISSNLETSAPPRLEPNLGGYDLLPPADLPHGAMQLSRLVLVLVVILKASPIRVICDRIGSTRYRSRSPFARFRRCRFHPGPDKDATSFLASDAELGGIEGEIVLEEEGRVVGR